MNAMKRLLAAAEKIEQAVEEQGLPWVSEADNLGQHDYALFDIDGLFSAETDHGPLIAMAVNAMPAVAAWLRWEATAACVPSHSRKALAVAAQILGEAS